MNCRRLREDVYDIAIANGAPANTKVMIAGLTNVYIHYVTTFEEYQMQEYEGGSTIFGPYTLDAHRQQYSYLAENLFTV